MWPSIFENKSALIVRAAERGFKMGILYGYCRVSTVEQNLDRQIAAMKAAGVPEENIFTDKMSGKNFNRAAYMRLIGTDGREPILQEGDCLVVLSLDRLGRDYGGLREEWRRITQDIKTDIKVLDMPLLDTTASDGTLDRTFISDLVLQLLSYVAAKERQSLLERQAGGIAAARAKGKYDRENHKGRKRKPVDAALFEELYQSVSIGLTSQKNAAAQLEISEVSLSRRFAEREAIGEGYDPNSIPPIHKT